MTCSKCNKNKEVTSAPCTHCGDDKPRFKETGRSVQPNVKSLKGDTYYNMMPHVRYREMGTEVEIEDMSLCNLKDMNGTCITFSEGDRICVKDNLKFQESEDGSYVITDTGLSCVNIFGQENSGILVTQVESSNDCASFKISLNPADLASSGGFITSVTLDGNTFEPVGGNVELNSSIFNSGIQSVVSPNNTLVYTLAGSPSTLEIDVRPPTVEGATVLPCTDGTPFNLIGGDNISLNVVGCDIEIDYTGSTTGATSVVYNGVTYTADTDGVITLPDVVGSQDPCCCPKLRADKELTATEVAAIEGTGLDLNSVSWTQFYGDANGNIQSPGIINVYLNGELLPITVTQNNISTLEAAGINFNAGDTLSVFYEGACN